MKNFYKINTINLTQIEYSAICKKCHVEVNGPSKQCFRCKEIKKASSYCINKGNLDGLHCYCVDCCKIERNKKRHVDKIILYPDNFKKCIKCEKQINKKFFFRNDRSNASINDEYKDECIYCYPNADEFLQCLSCLEIKEKKNFPKDRTISDGYKKKCKLCRKKKK